MSGSYGAKGGPRLEDRRAKVLTAVLSAGGEASTVEVARSARVARVEAARDLRRLQQWGLVASRLRSPRVRLWRSGLGEKA